ncbi:UDP-N-acetylglucosamine 2-epimerase [Infirmifilum sp.]|uniref:UDP-N-acetylglucosamine 2-epimerase n=1 Tax=Infirmifilum sp. TaxID=2856575 RepID=UPI003D121F19
MIVDTGQHYDYEMSRVFFEQLSIPEPHYFPSVGSGTHGYQVGEIIRRAEEFLLRERPDLVVVYDDASSALGCALVAAKAGCKATHVDGLEDLKGKDEQVANHIPASDCFAFQLARTEAFIACRDATQVRCFLPLARKEFLPSGSEVAR